MDAALYPELVVMPIDPPVRHDVILLWPSGRESAVSTAFVAYCTERGQA